MKKSFVFLLIAFLAIGLMVSCQPDQEVKQVARLVFFDEGTRGGYDSLTGATLNWDADDYYWTFSVSMPTDANDDPIEQPSGTEVEPGGGNEINVPETDSGSSTLSLTTGDLNFFVGDKWDFHIAGYATANRSTDETYGDPIFVADVEGVVMQSTTPINATVELTTAGEEYFGDGSGSLGFEKLVYTGGTDIAENTKAIVSVTVGSTTGYLTGIFDAEHKLTINNIAKSATSFTDDTLVLGSDTNIFEASPDSQEVSIKVFVYDADTADGVFKYNDTPTNYGLVAWCEPLDSKIYVYNGITTWIDCAFSGTGDIARDGALVKALKFNVVMPSAGGFVNLTDADISVKSIKLGTGTVTLTMAIDKENSELVDQGYYINLNKIELKDKSGTDNGFADAPYSGWSIGDTEDVVNPITSANKGSLVIELNTTMDKDSQFDADTDSDFVDKLDDEGETARVTVSIYSDAEGVNKIAQYVSPYVAITPAG